MKFATRFLFLTLVSAVAAPGTAPAAACCGGGFAAPSLIAGDDAGQLTASYIYSRVVDDVGTDSLWRRRSARETSATYKLEAAHVFRDRWQAGLSVPLVQRSLGVESSWGLGDTAATLGYEALPDWDYSAWRPKGLVFLQLTAPTGRAVSESTSVYQLDSRGRGFWAAGMGALLTKTFGAWDAFASLDAHRSFAKDYRNSESSGRLLPGWGGNAALGGGYNFTAWRIGAAITWTFEDPVDVSGATASGGTAQRLATAALSASYLFDSSWAATLAYADQTLFGRPLNTSLGRGATLLVQRRWAR